MDKKKGSLLVIFITIFIDLMGFGIIIPLSPFLVRRFDASPSEIGYLMSVFSLMQFLFSPVWGKLSDRVGRRPILLMSIVGAGLSYVAFAFAQSLWVLFVARIFAGIFSANISTAMAYIADITSKKDRSKGVGLVGAAFGLGFIFGPAMGGLFGEVGNWLGDQPPYGMSFSAVAAALLCFFNFFIALKYLPESLAPELRNNKKRTSRFLLLKKHIRSHSLVSALMMVFLLSGLAMAHMESTLFLFVEDEFGWGMKLASLGFAYIGVIMVFTQGFLVRRIIPLWGERRVMIVGQVLLMIGFGLIVFVHSIPFLGIAMTILALGNGLAHPAILGSLSLLADADEQGELMGVTQSLASLGRIIGPASGGYIYEHLSIRAPYGIAAVFVFIGVLLVLYFYKRLPEQGKS